MCKDEYRHRLRKHKRGRHCVGVCTDDSGRQVGFLCGCGYRTPAPLAYRRRVIRRELQAELRDEVLGLNHTPSP